MRSAAACGVGPERRAAVVTGALRHAAVWLRSAAVLAAVAPTSSALAAEQITASPTLAGKLGGSRPLAINAGITNSLGGIPAPLTQLAIDLPPGATYNFASAARVPALHDPRGREQPAGVSGRVADRVWTARVDAALGTTTLG